MWYNESAKRHRPQEGSLYGKNSTGSVPLSTNDEVSGRARECDRDSDTVQDSRKTVTKWRKRWDGTVQSLEDQSRRPKHMFDALTGWNGFQGSHARALAKADVSNCFLTRLTMI